MGEDQEWQLRILNRNDRYQPLRRISGKPKFPHWGQKS
jgi:hypothetical protein